MSHAVEFDRITVGADIGAKWLVRFVHRPNEPEDIQLDPDLIEYLWGRDHKIDFVTDTVERCHIFFVEFSQLDDALLFKLTWGGR
jgi:hypothetical protein